MAVILRAVNFLEFLLHDNVSDVICRRYESVPTKFNVTAKRIEKYGTAYIVVSVAGFMGQIVMAIIRA